MLWVKDKQSSQASASCTIRSLWYPRLVLERMFCPPTKTLQVLASGFIGHDDDTIDRNFSDSGSDKKMLVGKHDSGDNSMVSECRENFRLPQPIFQAFFWRHFVFHCREKTGILLTDLIMNVPAGVVLVSKRSGIRISFRCKHLRIPVLRNWWIRKHVRIRISLRL